jgi:hypothetical protein
MIRTGALNRRVRVRFECKVVAVGASASDIAACFICCTATTAAARITSAGATASRRVVSGRNGATGSVFETKEYIYLCLSMSMSMSISSTMWSAKEAKCSMDMSSVL